MKKYPTARVKEIWALLKKGHKVSQLTPYQFRINGVLDLFPVHCRYRNIKTNKRGFYPSNF